MASIPYDIARESRLWECSICRQPRIEPWIRRCRLDNGILRLSALSCGWNSLACSLRKKNHWVFRNTRVPRYKTSAPFHLRQPHQERVVSCLVWYVGRLITALVHVRLPKYGLWENVQGPEHVIANDRRLFSKSGILENSIDMLDVAHLALVVVVSASVCRVRQKATHSSLWKVCQYLNHCGST